MKNSKYNLLIDKLLQATTEGRLYWDSSSQSNEYQTSVGDILVLISGPRRSLGFNVNLNMENMSIALVNNEGVEIDRQKVETSDSAYDNFLDLFDMARKNYYKVDETLQKIIDEV